MRCPFCPSDDTQVVDSRASDEGDVIRRRRRCPQCGRRFTTYERVELAYPSIVKRDGARVDYERAKLRGSFLLSLRKRPVPIEAVDQAVTRIEEHLLAAPHKEMPSSVLGDLVMDELKRLDKVAYIRYASVYRSFEDVGEFSDLIKEVEPPKARRSKP